MTIYSRVIAYYAADILRDLVTLAFDLFMTSPTGRR